MTAETAVKLARFFEVPPEFWMNLQSFYDIEEAQKRYKKDLKSIHSNELPRSKPTRYQVRSYFFIRSKLRGIRPIEIKELKNAVA